MTLSCSTSAFKGPLEDALPAIARLGFSHVDLIAIPQWNHVSLPALVSSFDEEAGRVERLLDEHRLQVSALNMAFAHPHQRNDELNARRIAQAKAAAKLMNRLGVKIASFYPGYKVDDRPWDDVLRDTVATINELTAVAGAAGVTFAIEPHFSTPVQTVDQIRKLFAALPGLRIAYDPSHFAMQRINLRDTAFMLDRTVHVHVRDAAPDKMCVPPGTGTVDFKWLLSALKKRGYDAFVTIEYLPGGEGSAESQIAAMRDMLG